jgi:hypothetical protein
MVATVCFVVTSRPFARYYLNGRLRGVKQPFLRYRIEGTLQLDRECLLISKAGGHQVPILDELPQQFGIFLPLVLA